MKHPIQAIKTNVTVEFLKVQNVQELLKNSYFRRPSDEKGKRIKVYEVYP